MTMSPGPNTIKKVRTLRAHLERTTLPRTSVTSASVPAVLIAKTSVCITQLPSASALNWHPASPAQTGESSPLALKNRGSQHDRVHLSRVTVQIALGVENLCLAAPASIPRVLQLSGRRSRGEAIGRIQMLIGTPYR